jgi:hypothetical protein
MHEAPLLFTQTPFGFLAQRLLNVMSAAAHLGGESTGLVHCASPITHCQALLQFSMTLIWAALMQTAILCRWAALKT